MSLLITALAFLGGLFTAWVVGVNNSSVFGPVNAAGSVSVFQGSLIVGLASFAGAVTQGGRVADTLGNELVQGLQLDASAAALILLTASLIILASTLADIPMPAAFLLVGGTVGAGLGLGGTLQISTLTRIAGFWLLIPVIGAGIGYLSSRAIRRFMTKSDGNVKKLRYLLIGLGTYTAYTAGANRAGLPVGPLLNVIDVRIFHLLVFAGLGMVLGAWTGSPRIIQAVSRDYSRMGPRRAVGALLSAGLIAQAATLLGVPISFNQTVIFSVIGSGLVEGGEGVGKRKVLETVSAWFLALALSFAVTYGIARLLL
ncbi:MAG: anion permease [Candidatus Nanohaloarchaea archaeon]|nr:anion permease [Candidatus Nanohaloarchaea archaeon]